jgi:dipeptidyl aminopeptidase/acylaminoacyl peptidase
MKLRSIHLLLVYLAVMQSGAMARQDRGLPVDELLSRRAFLQGATIALSPDSKYVAYTVQDPRTYSILPNPKTSSCPGCEVSVTNIQTHTTRRLSDADTWSWGPVWSPKGRRLAYYSEFLGHQRVCIWEMASEVSRCVADVKLTAASYVNTPQWISGGDRLLTQALSEEQHGPNVKDVGGKADEDQATAIVYRNPTRISGESPPTEPISSTLKFVDLATGEIEGLAKVQNPAWFSVSPNGAYLAYTVRLPRESSNSYQDLFDLLVLDIASKRLRSMAHAIRALGGSSVSWSPDSTRLAYITYEVASYPDFRGECFVVSLASGQIDRITSGTHPSFANEYVAPAWSVDGKAVYLLPSDTMSRRSNGSPTADNSLWVANVSTKDVKELSRIPNQRMLAIVSPRANGRTSPVDGKGLLFVLTIDQGTKQAGCYLVNVSTGVYTKVFEADKAYGIFAQALSERSPDGNTIVFVGEEVSKTPNIFAISAQEHQLEQLTNLNPQLDRDSYAKSSLIEWYSTDGQPMRGALLFPRDYEPGKRYPLIIYQYPGSKFSDFLNCYGLGKDVVNMLPLSTRGYAILLPDSIVGPHSPMADIAKSVLPGINKVVELGVADPDRLGVMGHSYGGYGVLSLIVQSARFKAAVALAPANVDRIFQYGNLWTDGSSIFVLVDEGQLGGTPWDARDKYIENSPIFYLDRVGTPLLIIQGARDTGVPDRESDMVFVGLRRLGKEVEYAKYENEGHLITGYANQVDYMNRIIAWFDMHLKTP